MKSHEIAATQAETVTFATVECPWCGAGTPEGRHCVSCGGLQDRAACEAARRQLEKNAAPSLADCVETILATFDAAQLRGIAKRFGFAVK